MITPTAGYVIVKWEEEKKIEGEVVRDSGLVLPEHVANRLEEEATHKEFEVLSVSPDSKIKVGSRAITAKHTPAIKVKVKGKDYGVITEADIAAFYE